MIKVNNLTKSFSQTKKPAVDDISFEVESGKIACIIGTSGCGKTTTLKMINKLVTPTRGDIYVNGLSCLGHDDVQWRRSIGYVVQKAGLLPHLNVFDNISLLANIKKRDKKQIKERITYLMNIINMQDIDFLERYPKELSGGQQQRVGIARALMENPSVLLMDEPFGALDPITRGSLHEELLNLNSELKKTILIVTHDISEAFKLGDQIILMDNGKIIQAGSADDFRDRPVNLMVKNFIQGQLND